MATVIGKGSFRGFGGASDKPSSNETVAVTMETIDEDLPTHELIAKNLQSISALSTRLGLLLEKIDTKYDSHSVRTDLKVVQASITKLVKDTSDLLKTYSKEEPEEENEKRDWKIQSQRLKELFHDTLTSYREQQKTARIKQRTSLRQSMNASGLHNVDISSDGDLIADGEQLQVEKVKAEVDLDLIKERENDLKQLEKDIVDINDIFKQMAVLVEEQGDDIDVIEKNVEKAKEDVEVAVVELEQAVEYQQSSRRKMLFIALICAGIVVTIVVIIVIATQA